MRGSRWMWLSLFLAIIGPGCAGDAPSPDGGAQLDAGPGTQDAGPDGGTPEEDSGTDSGTGGDTDSGTGDDTDGGAGGDLDGGTDGGSDSGTDAGPPDTSVRVRRFLRYHTAGGVEERPEDFTRNPVELYLEDGGSLVAVPGMAGGPGEYVFPEVPFTPYYVKVGEVFVVTDARRIDLSVNRLGRADAQHLEYAPIVTMDLDGLEQWYDPDSFPFPLPERPSSRLELVSEELGLAGDITPGNADGQIQVQARVGLFLLSSQPMPRFEEARGDRAWVVQLNPRSFGSSLPDGGSQSYLTAVHALHFRPFSFDGTTDLFVAGMLQPLPMNELPLDWKVSAFAAHKAESHPAAELRGSTFSLHPAAHGTQEGWIGYSGALLELDRPLGEAADAVGTLHYGTPYASHWGLVGVASTNFGVRVQIGSESPLRLPARISVWDHASRLTAGPITPRILPPRQLTLDGVEAYSSRTLSVGGHVVGWQPPSSGRADVYRVELRRLDWRTQGGRTAVVVARLYVDGSATFVLLPSGLLQAGQHYYLSVRAFQAEGYDVSDRPLTLDERIVFGEASTVTGLLSVPAQ